MTSVEYGNMCIMLDECTHLYSFRANGELWSWNCDYKPVIICDEGEVLFSDAHSIEHEVIESGVGRGILSRYRSFDINGTYIEYAFDTIVWIEMSSGDIFCEWIPICEKGLHVNKVLWPGEMEFNNASDTWYTLINYNQGLLIPNTWSEELKSISFDGMYGTAGGYMPWFAQIRDRIGYIAICITPWNIGYNAIHPANGPYTHIGTRLEVSLGQMSYKRIIRYTFNNNCDYNELCKIYRSYVKEQGSLRTLREKIVKCKSIDSLVGCMFVHAGIKTSVCENSEFYDHNSPNKNNHITRFETRKNEMIELHRLGVEKLYLHLDGWAEPGYDNMHPDYMPACEEAGGWAGMRDLSDTMRELGFLFGIHDQYRDYYKSAPSFNVEYACQLRDGSIPEHRRWAGGPQSYLCGTQARYYVRRNYSKLYDNGIHIDGAYLDVFTCNEGDECNNLHHMMSRRECYEYRNLCFEYLLSRDILPSSEEVSDWCIPSLALCHYAPYDFMLRKISEPRMGIPVPLFNLVYHDCIIEPWMMDKADNGEDYMLYALINGGAPYLIREGAYPDFDGAFESIEIDIIERIERCKVVSDLHKKVAKEELIRHEIIDGNPMLQRSIFADGTVVDVDFIQSSYSISEA